MHQVGGIEAIVAQVIVKYLISREIVAVCGATAYLLAGEKENGL